MRIRSLPLLLVALFALPYVHAERKPQRRSEATHVVVGQVTGVFESARSEYIRRVVRIRVEAIDRGDGLVAGRYFYAERSGSSTATAGNRSRSHEIYYLHLFSTLYDIRVPVEEYSRADEETPDNECIATIAISSGIRFCTRRTKSETGLVG